jgi:2-oxoglutarate ferredoxin oxidoreductase subunit gamma
MYEELFIAGSGGQGVLTLGKILVYSAMEEGKFATYYPSYGAEVRGGTANCMVKISDSFIYSPVVEEPTMVTIMNMPSYIKFLKKFIPQKFLFLNTTLIEEKTEIIEFLKSHAKNLEIVRVNATEIANKIGTTLVSNIVMLTTIVKRTNVVKIDSVRNILSKIFSKKTLDINLKAIDYVMANV